GRRARRRQGAEVAGALAADQADGHCEDGEREEGADGRRDCHDLGRRALLPTDLDREARFRRGIASVGDLAARQRATRLEEPAGRTLLTAGTAETVERDEVRRIAAAVSPEEVSADVDLLDVRDTENLAASQARDDELVGLDAAIQEEVRARLDSGGVDSQVFEHCWRGDIELRLAAVALPSDLPR